MVAGAREFFPATVARVVVVETLSSLAVMRRVRAAVIQTSRWPSYGTARIALFSSSAPRAVSFYCFPSPRPVWKWANLQQLCTTERHSVLGLNFGKMW